MNRVTVRKGLLNVERVTVKKGLKSQSEKGSVAVRKGLSLLPATHLLLHQRLKGNGVLLFLVGLIPHLLEDEARREGVAVDAAVSIGTLPEPAVDSLFYRVQEVLADLVVCVCV